MAQLPRNEGHRADGNRNGSAMAGASQEVKRERIVTDVDTRIQFRMIPSSNSRKDRS